jgi:hypothetical protein
VLRWLLLLLLLVLLLLLLLLLLRLLLRLVLLLLLRLLVLLLVLLLLLLRHRRCNRHGDLARLLLLLQQDGLRNRRRVGARAGRRSVGTGGSRRRRVRALRQLRLARRRVQWFFCAHDKVLCVCMV